MGARNTEWVDTVLPNPFIAIVSTHGVKNLLWSAAFLKGDELLSPFGGEYRKMNFRANCKGEEYILDDLRVKFMDAEDYVTNDPMNTVHEAKRTLIQSHTLLSDLKGCHGDHSSLNSYANLFFGKWFDAISSKMVINESDMMSHPLGMIHIAEFSDDDSLITERIDSIYTADDPVLYKRKLVLRILRIFDNLLLPESTPRLLNDSMLVYNPPLARVLLCDSRIFPDEDDSHLLGIRDAVSDRWPADHFFVFKFCSQHIEPDLSTSKCFETSRRRGNGPEANVLPVRCFTHSHLEQLQRLVDTFLKNSVIPSAMQRISDTMDEYQKRKKILRIDIGTAFMKLFKRNDHPPPRNNNTESRYQTTYNWSQSAYMNMNSSDLRVLHATALCFHLKKFSFASTFLKFLVVELKRDEKYPLVVSCLELLALSALKAGCESSVADRHLAEAWDICLSSNGYRDVHAIRIGYLKYQILTSKNSPNISSRLSLEANEIFDSYSSVESTSLNSSPAQHSIIGSKLDGNIEVLCMDDQRTGRIDTRDAYTVYHKSSNNIPSSQLKLVNSICSGILQIIVDVALYIEYSPEVCGLLYARLGEISLMVARHRKAAFYYILAGRAFERSDLPELALRCFCFAFYLYTFFGISDDLKSFRNIKYSPLNPDNSNLGTPFEYPSPDEEACCFSGIIQCPGKSAISTWGDVSVDLISRFARSNSRFCKSVTVDTCTKKISSASFSLYRILLGCDKCSCSSAATRGKTGSCDVCGLCRIRCKENSILEQYLEILSTGFVEHARFDLKQSLEPTNPRSFLPVTPRGPDLTSPHDKGYVLDLNLPIVRKLHAEFDRVSSVNEFFVLSNPTRNDIELSGIQVIETLSCSRSRGTPCDLLFSSQMPISTCPRGNLESFSGISFDCSIDGELSHRNIVLKCERFVIMVARRIECMQEIIGSSKTDVAMYSRDFCFVWTLKGVISCRTFVKILSS